MNKAAHQVMKYMALGFAGILLVLCLWTVKPVVEVDLPSDGSVWMANLSTDIFAVQPCVLSCDSGQNLLDDAFEDLDDAIFYRLAVKFFARTDISQDGPGACPHSLWQPLHKIPIARL